MGSHAVKLQGQTISRSGCRCLNRKYLISVRLARTIVFAWKMPTPDTPFRTDQKRTVIGEVTRNFESS